MGKDGDRNRFGRCNSVLLFALSGLQRGNRDLACRIGDRDRGYYRRGRRFDEGSDAYRDCEYGGYDCDSAQQMGDGMRRGGLFPFPI